MSELVLTDFVVGQRVELHPVTDAWMCGDRFGRISKIGRKYVYVACDRSGRMIRVHPKWIGEILAPA